MHNLKPICHRLRTGSARHLPQPHSLALSRARRLGLEGTEHLFAYVEPQDESSGASYASELVTKVIQEAFASANDRGATGLVQRILRNANTVLWDWNSGNSPALRHFVGITCVLVRPDKIYVAQTLPGQMLLCHQRQLTALPATASLLTELRGGNSPAGRSLGMASRLEVECHCFSIFAGDILMIGPSKLGMLVRPGDVERGLLGTGGPGAAEFLMRRASERKITLGDGLVIELASEDGIVESLPNGLQAPGRVVRTVSSTAAGMIANAAGAAGERASRPRATTSPRDHGESTESRPKAAKEEQRTAQAGGRGEGGRKPAPSGRAERGNKTDSQKASSASGSPPRSGRTRVAQSYPEVSAGLRPAARRRQSPAGGTALGLTAMLVKGLLAGSLMRLLPDTAYEDLRDRANRVVSSRWLPVGVIMAILSIMLIAASAMYINQQRTLGELQSTLAKVDQLSAGAAAATTQDEARAKLEEAASLLERVGSSESNNALVTDRKKAISAQLDKVNSVIRLSSIETLLDMKGKVDGPTRLGQVVVGDGVAYLLDTAGGAVYAYNLASHGIEKIMAEGWVVDNHMVGMVQQIGWRDGGPFLLDGNNVVYLFDPPSHTWHRFSLQGADGWGTSRDIASLNGDLYVLSVADNQIFKYTSGTLTDPPAKWLAEGSRLDLSQARGLSVDDKAYVLLADGRVLRLKDGKLEETLQITLYPNLVSPIEMAATLQGACLYMVDTYNRRILVMTKDGQQQWQLLAPEDSTLFDDIRGIYVDEKLHTIWIASGSRLLQSVLPSELPQQFSSGH